MKSQVLDVDFEEWEPDWEDDTNDSEDDEFDLDDLIVE